MAFHLIDLENWERREHYQHFIREVVCSYSMTVNLDITALEGFRLYPAMAVAVDGYGQCIPGVPALP